MIEVIKERVEELNRQLKRLKKLKSDSHNKKGILECEILIIERETALKAWTSTLNKMEVEKKC